MAKALRTAGSVLLSVFIGIIIAKAQTDPTLPYGWILRDPRVVPVLIAALIVCVLVFAGQFAPVATVYWKLFRSVVPLQAADGTPLPLMGLTIKSARWYCTVRGTEQDVTRALQGKVAGGYLKVHAHDNVLGDVCKLHGGTGDPKTLEVEFVYHSRATATHDEWLTIPCQEDRTRELLREIERRSSDVETHRIELLNCRHTAQEQAATAQKMSRDLQAERDSNEKLSAKVQDLQARIPVVEDPAKDIDPNTYQLLRNAFPQDWRQRLALKWIWQQSSCPLEQFRLTCENSGFADFEEKMVKPILGNRVLVDSDDKAAWIKTQEARKVLTQLFREFPLC
ncbi:MAG TPA: hypothetical protein VGN17_26020 [Bryobacteraceae bacterium]|jgi:hypothetical protein